MRTLFTMLTLRSAERGKNRNGLSLLEALRQLGRWTSQEFEGIVGLWLEQSRQGMSWASTLPGRWSDAPTATESQVTSPFVAEGDRLLQG